MTREEVLEYINLVHGDALQEAGIEATDTPENLYYILYDAMIYEAAGEARQQAVADAKVTQLIADKKAAAEEQRQLAEADAKAAAKAAQVIADKTAVGEEHVGNIRSQ